MGKYKYKEWKEKKIKNNTWIPEKEYRKKMIERNVTPPPNILNREIILDTETTGLSNNDKIVEISLLETVCGVKTGRKLHFFLNPVTQVSKKAAEIHGLTNEKLEKFPKFFEVAENIINFIGEGNIVAHNAKFDRRMLNNELIRCDKKTFPENRFIDTLKIARFLFPKVPNNQDALCKRFDINNYNRLKTGIHSAMEDTIMLYFIYQKMKVLLDEKEMEVGKFKIM